MVDTLNELPICGIYLYLVVFDFSLLGSKFSLYGHSTERRLENVLREGTDALECLSFACCCNN